MLQPKEKVIDIVNELLDVLRSNADLGDQELLKFREIKSLDQESPLTDLAYALFYCTKKDVVRADKFFVKSIRTGSFDCVGNYISFLIKNRYIRKAINIKNRFTDMLLRNLDSRSAEILLVTSSLEGNMKIFEYCLSEFRKRNSDLVELMTYMEEKIMQHNAFMKIADISPDQVSKILSIMIDIFEQSNIDNLKFPMYEIDPDHGINALVMYVETDNMVDLVDANFLLAERIADDEQFIGKKFTPIFEIFNGINNKEYREV